jgi:muramoyltetrapeptide carboxypeptidase LdcA involved in peptidoglycan recycling
MLKAIWCVKGGYGTVQIIDLLDFANLNKVKMDCWFCDIHRFKSF